MTRGSRRGTAPAASAGGALAGSSGSGAPLDAAGRVRERRAAPLRRRSRDTLARNPLPPGASTHGPLRVSGGERGERVGAGEIGVAQRQVVQMHGRALMSEETGCLEQRQPDTQLAGLRSQTTLSHPQC